MCWSLLLTTDCSTVADGSDPSCCGTVLSFALGEAPCDRCMLTYFCVWLVAGRSSVKKSYFYFSLPLFDFKEVTNTNCRLLGCSHCFCVTSFRNSGSGPPCESLNTHNAKLGMKLNLSRFLFKFSAIFKQKKILAVGRD